MAKAENGEEDFGDFFDEVVPGLTFESDVGRTSLCGKLDRLLDGEGGEMDIVLWGELDVAAIMTGDIFRGERIVVNVALNVVVGIALVCEHLEEGGASRSWTSQND